MGKGVSGLVTFKMIFVYIKLKWEVLGKKIKNELVEFLQYITIRSYISVAMFVHHNSEKTFRGRLCKYVLRKGYIRQRIYIKVFTLEMPVSLYIPKCIIHHQKYICYFWEDLLGWQFKLLFGYHQVTKFDQIENLF